MKPRPRRRRTTVLSLSAAALVATPLLTGCSTGSHPGAAAVVGEERITVAEVQAHVEDVRDAQRAQPEADQLISGTSGLTRQTVNFLVYVEVLELAADDHGVTVTRREVQGTRDQAEQYAGGKRALERAALMPQDQSTMPFAASQIDEVLRANLLLQDLSEQVGDDRIYSVLEEAAEDAGVDVSPRYGSWNAAAVSLTDADMPWLRAADAAS